MLREYSKIKYPIEVLEIDRVGLWKGDQSKSIILREYPYIVYPDCSTQHKLYIGELVVY